VLSIMADYRGLLKQAVDSLPENNGASRRKVYEKARTALVAQLRAIVPPLPAREITKHRLELEDCIRQVEEDATEELLAALKQREEVARLEEQQEQAQREAKKEAIEAEEAATEANAQEEVKIKEEAKEAEVAAEVAAREAEALEAEIKAKQAEAEEKTKREAEAQEEEILSETKAKQEKSLQEAIEEENALQEVEAEQVAAEAKALEEAKKVEIELEKVVEPADIEIAKDDGVAPDAEPEEEKNGSISFAKPDGEVDDLQKISGIGPKLEEKLHELGIIQFAQIAAFSDKDIIDVDEALSFKGRIERENWIGQAKDFIKTDEDIVQESDDEITVSSEIETQKEEVKEEGTEASAKSEGDVVDEVKAINLDLEADEEKEIKDDALSSIDDVIAQAKQATNVSEKAKAPEIDLHKTDLDKAEIPEVDIVNIDVAKSSEVDVEIINDDIIDDKQLVDSQTTIDKAIETLDRAARGEKIEDAPSVENEDQKPLLLQNDKDIIDKDISPEMAKRSNALTTFLFLLLLLLLGVALAGYWAIKQGYISPEAMFGESTQVAEEANKEAVAEANNATKTPAVDDTPNGATNVRDVTPDQNSNEVDATGPGNTQATPNVVVPVEERLDEERLANEGSLLDNPQEIQATDVAQANSLQNGEKNEERLSTQETLTPVEPAGELESATSEVADNVTEIGGAQSLLLEASSEGTIGAVPYSGSVAWSRGVDELGLPILLAKANIPARNLNVELLIRRNSDQSLPASHLMEVNFETSETFSGGSIEGLPGILLKNEELVQGSPLIGASARVVKNSFLFALSAADQDVIKNTKLLKTQKWLDIALVYGTGKRAIITFEKDGAAQAMFDEVFKIWEDADKNASTTPATNSQ